MTPGKRSTPAPSSSSPSASGRLLALRYPAWRPHGRSPVLWALLAWLAVNALAAAFGADWSRSLWSVYVRQQGGLVALLGWTALAFVVAAVYRGAADRRRLLLVWCGVSVLVAVFALLSWHELWPFFNPPDHYTRLFSPAGNPTATAAYNVGAILLSAGLLLTTPWRRGRLAWADRGRLLALALPALALAFNMWTLWLTEARMAPVALAAGLLALGAVLLWRGAAATGSAGVRRRRRRLRLVAAALLALALLPPALFAAARFTPVLDGYAERGDYLWRVKKVGLDDNSVRSRLAGARAAWAGALERPLLGWGPENYAAVWGHYGDGEYTKGRLDRAHSQPLEELVNAGVPGLLAWLVLWGLIFRALLRAARRPDDDGGAVALLGLLTGVFVMNLVHFDTMASLLALAVAAGLAGAAETERVRSAAPSPAAARRPPWLRLNLRLAPPLRTAVLVVAVLAALALLALAPGRLYLSAAALHNAASSPYWQHQLVYYHRAMAAFPGMDREPRRHLLAHIAHHMGGMPPAPRERALALGNYHARKLRADHPGDWHSCYVAGRFYAAAAALEPAPWRETALRTARQCRELAPGLRETRELLAAATAGAAPPDTGISP